VCEQLVIYVCSLSDVSVIVCTDMGNIYNCTSGRIKYPTVHLTNVCENRSRPFTYAETRQNNIRTLFFFTENFSAEQNRP